jgi:hypothetical protein
VSPVDDQYLEVGLLRSLEWMSEQSVSTAGDRTVLNLPEMGAKGDFQVVSIDPCQIVLGDQGRRITGIFRHRRGLVYDLSITGTSDLVRVTRLHPIWSVDREDWIAMKDLLVGERLLTSTGTATVLDLVERGEEPVYNIEVDGDHCYRVGQEGLLVHNASAVLQPFLTASDRARANDYVYPGATLRANSPEDSPLFRGMRNLGALYYKIGTDGSRMRLPSSGFIEGTNPSDSHSEQRLLDLLPKGCPIIIEVYTEREPCKSCDKVLDKYAKSKNSDMDIKIFAISITGKQDDMSSADILRAVYDTVFKRKWW